MTNIDQDECDVECVCGQCLHHPNYWKRMEVKMPYLKEILDEFVQELTDEDLLNIFEVAYQCLSNEKMRDQVGDIMDTDDSYLLDLRDKLDQFLNEV